MAIEFNHFSSQSFEKMVQAISAKVLGAGVVVFGSGPDGAREATFEGKMSYPSDAEPWNGYLVVQAKCKEKLIGNQNDANWLCAQLRNDLDKFLDKKRNLKKPQYYIIATNVTLSPEPKNGGRKKVDEVFDEYSRKLGLQGWSVWSADELRVHLENNESVRRAYSAWITPSDVLSSLIDQLKLPNLSHILPLALMRELKNGRDVRLRDAGQETDEPVHLEEVFVDLPLTNNDQLISQNQTQEVITEPDEFEHAYPKKTEPGTQFAAQELIRRIGFKLDPASFGEEGSEKRTRKNRVAPPNRIVLMGGPGQGKSTVTQFVAQYQRARVLSTLDRSSLTDTTRDIVENILAKANNEGVELSGPARFPIRISLPDFADLLAKDNSKSSLLAYAANALSKDTDKDFSPDDLRTWIGTCPVLILLDGLDEVPPSSNRQQVLQSIEALWDDIAIAKGDALMVVTTRPQGYNDDLNPRYWQHWELSPLPPKHAMKVATRLANVRISDAELRQSVLDELRTASDDPITAALLESPLQVAILFGIALLKGAIPNDRWDLFDRYYVLLRDREAQKPNSLVRDYKRHIDAIHQEAGLLLHVESETSGGANPFLTQSQLETMIERLLDEDGFRKEKLKEIATELSRIATQRLVLLAMRVEGQIAFDVRSLQEFMAAARLTKSSKIPITTRLRVIASKPHWRHVFRIVASKIFATNELGHFRSDILGICNSLEAGDEGWEEKATMSGAHLALDLLDDNIATDAPKFRRQLLAKALTILRLGPDRTSDRLVVHFGDENLDVFLEAFELALDGRSRLSARAAWRLLSLISLHRADWVTQVLKRLWPKDPCDVLDYAVGCVSSNWSEEVVQKVQLAQWAAGPVPALRFANRLGSNFDSLTRIPSSEVFRIAVLPKIFFQSRLSHRVAQSTEESNLFRFNFVGIPAPIREVTIRKTHEFLFKDVAKNPMWQAVQFAALFATDPNKLTLAKCLSQLAKLDSADVLQLRSYQVSLPWVLSTVLTEHFEGIPLSVLSKEAGDGAFGDIADWHSAEERLSSKGAKVDDLKTWVAGRYLNSQIAKTGVPAWQMSIGMHDDEISQSAFTEFLTFIDSLPISGKKIRLIKLLGVIWQRSRRLRERQEDEVTANLRKKNGSQFVSSLLRNLEAVDPGNVISIRPLVLVLLDLEFDWAPDERIANALQILAKSDITKLPNPRYLNSLVNLYNRFQDSRGILEYIANGLIMTTPDDLPNALAGIDTSAFLSQESESPRVRGAVAKLRIAAGRWGLNDVEEFENLFSSLDCKLNWSDIYSIVRNGAVSSHPNRLALVKVLVALMKDADEELVRLVDFLRSNLDKIPSNLVERQTRESLDLPSL